MADTDTPAPVFDIYTRRVLKQVWALYEIEMHTPQDIDGGPTCDERGCVICNGGTEAIDYIVEMFDPDDQELLDALIGLAQEWNG